MMIALILVPWLSSPKVFRSRMRNSGTGWTFYVDRTEGGNIEEFGIEGLDDDIYGYTKADWKMALENWELTLEETLSH